MLNYPPRGYMSRHSTILNIMDFLQSGEKTLGEIVEYCYSSGARPSKPMQSAMKSLSILRRRGSIVRVKRGVYAIAP